LDEANVAKDEATAFSDEAGVAENEARAPAMDLGGGSMKRKDAGNDGSGTRSKLEHGG